MSFHHVQFFKSRSSTYSSKTFLIHCTDPVSISIWSKVTKLIQSSLILFGYSRKGQSCAPKIPNKIGAEKGKVEHILSHWCDTTIGYWDYLGLRFSLEVCSF